MTKETLPQISVGETLRMSRERTGQDLRYVADMLRIRYVYLEAIEKGDYRKLPGAPYVIGFVRAYADHLNLNSVEIVERFKQEREDLDQQTQLVFPKPLPEGKVPSGGILLVALVLGVLVYGAWFFLSGQDKPIAELIPEIPARLMALVGGDEEETAEPETAAPAGPQIELPTLPDETAAVTETTPAATAPAERAEPPAEETAASDAAISETDEETAAATEPAPEPATEPAPEPAPEPQAAEPAQPVTEPTETLTAQPVVDEPAPEPVAEAPTPIVSEPIVEPEAVPEPEPAEETDTAIAEAPAETAAPTAQADETAAAAPEDDDAAAIAQRVLEELAQTDEPAETQPRPATASSNDETATPVNGDTAVGEPTAVGPQQPAGEVPVAAITPAARTQDDPAGAAATAARGNGAGSAATPVLPGRPAGKIYGEENVQSRILITARVDSWVEVSTQQGELLLTRVLRAGDSFKVPDQAGLSLVTGNAGGLAISVDGSQVPDLGPVGAVRRGVELDPDRLKAGTAGNL